MSGGGVAGPGAGDSLPACVLAWPLFSVCTEREGGREGLPGVSSFRDTNPAGSGPYPVTSLHLTYLLGHPISAHRHPGVRASM